MQASDYDSFRRTLQSVADLFGKELTNELVQLYWDALADQSYESVERRVKDYMKRAKFFPKPANLRPAEVDQHETPVNPEAEARFQSMLKENERGWNQTIEEKGVIGKLMLAEALLARYDTEPDQMAIHVIEKRKWLKERVADLLREADPAEVLRNQHCKHLVLRLFNDAGLARLEQKAKAA